MAIFKRPDIEIHVVFELIDDINDHYLISEKALIELEQVPEDSALIQTLCRSVHTIKNDLEVVGFSPAKPIVIALQDLLALLVDDYLDYDSLVGDVILLLLDRIKIQVEYFRLEGELEYQESEYQDFTQRIAELINLAPAQQKEILISLVSQLDPSVDHADENFESLGIQGNCLFQGQGLEDDPDLCFFRDLLKPVEARSYYWQGRADRILRLSLILNQLGGVPVDKAQLATAVYVHDFGMSCMPLELLHKEAALTDDDIVLLRSHVMYSTSLLQHMEKWQAATEIVMQHHEAVDGSGYPVGLKDQDICDGAKIIAIADTFDALTHQRAAATHQKRPIIRAVREINDCAGKTLSRYWVEIFNQAVEPVLAEYRARKP